MAEDFQVFDVAVPVGGSAASPQKFALPMPPRVITGVEMLVPDGVRGNVHFALGAAGTPFIPSNNGGFFTSNNEVLKYTLAGYITSGAWQLLAYNTGTLTHTIQVRFLTDLVRVGGLGPMSLLGSDLLGPGGEPTPPAGGGVLPPTGGGGGGGGVTVPPPSGITVPPGVTGPMLPPGLAPRPAITRTEFAQLENNYRVRVSGSGFVPGSKLVVSGGGTVVRDVLVAADGTFHVTIQDTGFLIHGRQAVTADDLAGNRAVVFTTY